MLPIFFNLFGVSFSILIPSRGEESHFNQNFKLTMYCSLIALLEFVGQYLGLNGLVYAGSGIYQVLYSTVVIIVAILSRFILKRFINSYQWGFIILVTLGLCVNTYGNVSKTEEDSMLRMKGIFYTLASTFIFALSYVSTEYVLKKLDPPKTKMQARVGLFALLYILIYLILYTIPHWNTLVMKNIEDNKGDYVTIFFGYSFIMVSAFFHSYSYYRLLHKVGSISTGLLQSIRAVSVFIASHIFFCGDHMEQCMTKQKILSTIIVFSGVTGYTLTSQPPTQENLLPIFIKRKITLD